MICLLSLQQRAHVNVRTVFEASSQGLRSIHRPLWVVRVVFVFLIWKRLSHVAQAALQLSIDDLELLISLSWALQC